MRSITTLVVLVTLFGCEGGATSPGEPRTGSARAPTGADAKADWRPCAHAPKPSEWDVVLWVDAAGRSKSLTLAEAYIATGNPWSLPETELKPVIAWTALYTLGPTDDGHRPLRNLITSQGLTDATLTPHSVLRDIRALAPDQELQTLFAAADGRQRLVTVTRSGRSKWSARVEDVLNVRLPSSFGDLGITDLPGPITLRASPYGADFGLDAEGDLRDECRNLVLLSPGQDEARRKAQYTLESAWAQNTALQRRLEQIEEYEAQAGE